MDINGLGQKDSVGTCLIELVNGTIMLAEVLREDANYVYVKRPLRFQPQQNPQTGQLMISLVQLVPFLGKEVQDAQNLPLNRQNILWWSKINQVLDLQEAAKMEKTYTENTTRILLGH